VLDQACKQLREWHDQGFVDLRMAVNLSTVQLHHAELPRVVNNLLQIYRRHRAAWSWKSPKPA
jgi:EAL domain-containing protein (putative c-di-GMP-specific phosphodiesterase class I)